MRAIQVTTHGGPEVLVYTEVPTPEPGPGEVRIAVEAAGVNFIDVYKRTGAYQVPLPFIPGEEAAGYIDAVGPDVSDFKEGDRVAYTQQIGAYAGYAVVPAAKVVPVPDGVETTTAAAVMLQGMTAHYLTHSTYRIQPGDQALVHAAAGGLGLLLCQMAKRLGAYVIGTVSTEEKARLAREAGADEVILYTEQDFVAETRRLTGGRGVHVVYDTVGKTTFEGSLDSLRPRGYLALAGQSSGAVAPVNPQVLNAKGSLFLTRPTLGHYVADRAELLWRAGDLFNWIRAGELKVRVDRKFPLAEAGGAHRELEARRTSGKLLLIPVPGSR
jgi:NADPH2:quinone reductase